MRTNRFGRRCVKLALTGGPCSGKTTAQSVLAERIAEEFGDQWRVFTVNEASSFLYQGGVIRAEMDEARVKQWQKDILLTTLQLESVYDHIGELESERNVLILCDRGSLDAKAFTTSARQWEEILEEVARAETELMARYDAVIQLHVAPREFYCRVADAVGGGHGGANPYRRESHAEALAVDRKYAQIWARHRRRFEILDEDADNAVAENVVDNDANNASFDAKLEKIYAIVKLFL